MAATTAIHSPFRGAVAGRFSIIGPQNAVLPPSPLAGEGLGMRGRVTLSSLFSNRRPPADLHFRRVL
ncbi:hypothetical protein D3C79_1112190 [compost metagenome]